MEFKRYFYTNHYVSKTGVVKTLVKGKEKILKPLPKHNGPEVEINGKKIKVSRMIMICFEPRIDYPYVKVKYLDHNKLNNNFDNLKWSDDYTNQPTL